MATIRLPTDFKEFFELLNSEKVDYLLVGGYAVIYYGYSRATGDIDVWVRVSEQNAEAIWRALTAFGFSTTSIDARMFLAHSGRLARREFLSVAAAAATALAAPAAAWDSSKLAFVEEGSQYRFDTGVLRGVLRPNGASMGLASLEHVASGASLASSLGIFSHYRLLDADARHGDAAWDWDSAAELLADGAVRARWTADQRHPFDMTAVYRWSAADTLDLTTQVTAMRPLQRLEVFLASYFNGFARAYALVQSSDQTAGQTGFHEAIASDAVWHMFPRDRAAVAVIQDGRWKRPPHPVEWQIMPELAGGLAMRRDEATGLAALVMAPAADCFAISMPYGEESHRSLYLSLLGNDLAQGQSATAHTRLVIRHNVSDGDAVRIYEQYARRA